MSEAVSETIKCPKCGHSFALSEALASALREEARSEYATQAKELKAQLQTERLQIEAREQALNGKEKQIDQHLKEALAKERDRLTVEARANASEDVAAQLQVLKSELEGKSAKLAQALKREAEVDRRDRELNELAAKLESDFESKLKDQTRQAEVRARGAADQAWQSKIDEMQKELTASEKHGSELRAKEAALLRKERELKDQADSVELTVQRTLREERDAMQATLRKGVQSEFSLKLAERDKVIEDLGTTIKELQQKQEQGSQQLQGEAQELVLEDLLRTLFPTDSVEPVPKGIEGADCLHRVVARDGRIAGTIVWESKRTKRWNAQWVPKLKSDQMRVEGHLAAILSNVLPSEVTNFGEVDGVWVTDFDSVRGLAVALRRMLLEAFAARQSQEGKSTKMEQMYAYLTSGVFAQRVQAMMSAYAKMKSDLSKERLAIQRLWAKREKQLDGLILGTAGMHGDISGIVGQDMPTVPELEFAGEDEDGEQAE